MIANQQATIAKLDNIGRSQSVQVDAAGANAPTVNIINTRMEVEEPQLEEQLHELVESQPQISNVNDPNFVPKNWEYKLRKKGDSCHKFYPQHIKAFRKKMGTHQYYSQDDIDNYLYKLNEDDKKAEPGKAASKSKKLHIRSALRWYLCDYLKLNVNLKAFNMKSNV